MKKQRIPYIQTFVSIAALAAAALAACAARDASQSGTAPASTVQVKNVDSHVITVAGSQEVYVVPDIAQLVFRVTTEAQTAQECQQKNTENLQQVLSYLKSQGLEETSIQTSNYSLEPMYDWNNGRTITGYEMSTRVTVSQAPLEQAGTLVTNVVQNGANEVESVSYLSSKYDESYQDALKKAIEDAKAKAEAMAAVGGCTLGPIVHIEEYAPDTQARSASQISGYTAAKRAEEANDNAAAMEIMPGQMKVQAQVTVDFSCQNTLP